ncbi:hypothetical protein KFK09_007799 [Dendrobium nobile]|uniref:Uncharacterized protein n=1 Tax=Dendrobium nobile TaxID=94219 RepID=A0A8T3BXK1_DENNO|nr:hypothetical protein KFK09_007799 [Dendrobium nobile]
METSPTKRSRAVRTPSSSLTILSEMGTRRRRSETSAETPSGKTTSSPPSHDSP